MRILSVLRRGWPVLTGCCLLACTAWPGGYVRAASLTAVSVTLADRTAGATDTTYTVSFATGSAASLKRVAFRFSTTAGGSARPAGQALSAVELGQVNNLGSGWDIDVSQAAYGIIAISRDTAGAVGANAPAVVVLQHMSNPDIRDCDASGTHLDDTCYLAITTYSDDGSTSVDTGQTTYSFADNPELSFSVSGVGAGETHNGITTTVESTGTSLDFGHIDPDQVGYAAHALNVSTNAPGGYKVYAYLLTPLTGTDTRNAIDPFGAPDATWSTPQAWTTPTGSARSSNSGWFGANTSDTRVSGWSGATAKFGPLSTVPHIVAQSSSADPSGTTVYVTYALGINHLQPSDSYSGTVSYDVQATY